MNSFSFHKCELKYQRKNISVGQKNCGSRAGACAFMVIKENEKANGILLKLLGTAEHLEKHVCGCVFQKLAGFAVTAVAR